MRFGAYLGTARLARCPRSARSSAWSSSAAASHAPRFRRDRACASRSVSASSRRVSSSICAHMCGFVVVRLRVFRKLERLGRGVARRVRVGRLAGGVRALVHLAPGDGRVAKIARATNISGGAASEGSGMAEIILAAGTGYRPRLARRTGARRGRRRRTTKGRACMTSEPRRANTCCGWAGRSSRRIRDCRPRARR